MSQPLRIILAFAIGFGIYKMGQNGLGTSAPETAPGSVTAFDKH